MSKLLKVTIGWMVASAGLGAACSPAPEATEPLTETIVYSTLRPANWVSTSSRSPAVRRVS